MEATARTGSGKGLRSGETGTSTPTCTQGKPAIAGGNHDGMGICSDEIGPRRWDGRRSQVHRSGPLPNVRVGLSDRTMCGRIRFMFAQRVSQEHEPVNRRKKSVFDQSKE